MPSASQSAGVNSLIGSHTPVYPVSLVGIFCDSTDSTSTSRRNAAASSGGDRIDVKSGTPLKPGRLRQTRHNLYMPVIMCQLLRVKGGRVNDVIVGGPVQGRLDLGDHLLHHPGKVVDAVLLDVLVVAGMRLRQDPGLERKPAGKGAEGHEARACPARSASRAASSCWIMSQ